MTVTVSAAERLQLIERLGIHADSVEACGHLNAARYMRYAADEIESQAKALSEAEAERDRIKAFLSEGDWQTIESEQAWRRRALAAEARLAAEERSHFQTIGERDDYHQWADRLAHAIGGDEIGEHSNLNNPWANALELTAARAFTNAAKTQESKDA